MTIIVKVEIDGAEIKKSVHAWDENLKTCDPRDASGSVFYRYYRRAINPNYGEGWEHWSAGPFDDLHKDDQHLLEL